MMNAIYSFKKTINGISHIIFYILLGIFSASYTYPAGAADQSIDLTNMDAASKNFILNLVSPNYGKKVQIGTSYTAPSAGYISAHSDRDDCYCDVYIDGLNIKIGAHFRGYHEYDSTVYPVAAGSSVSWSGQGCTVYFIPR